MAENVVQKHTNPCACESVSLCPDKLVLRIILLVQDFPRRHRYDKLAQHINILL